MTGTVDVLSAARSLEFEASVPELIRDTMASALIAGPNVTISPDDVGNGITISFDSPDDENVGGITTIYVKTTGSDTNPGTFASPLRTPTAAMNLLKTKGPVLRGTWIVDIGAGSYTSFDIPQTLFFENPLTIQGADVGGHPNTPTVTITNGYNTSDYGIDARNLNFSLIVKDLLFTGYNGSTSSAGILLNSSKGTLFTINCHFVDCYWGISAQTSAYDVKGGKATRCGMLGDTANTLPIGSRNGNGGAYRSLMQSRHAIGLQDAGTLANGPIVTFCRTGLFAQENSTGHSDFVTYEDNDTAVLLNASSRANVDGSSFKRNTKDIRGTLGSNAYVTVNNVFGTGTDESVSKISMASGSHLIDDNRLFTNKLPANGASLRNVYTSFPGTVVSTIAATVVDTLTFAANVWRDTPNSVVPVKRVAVKIIGELTGTAGTKTVQCRFGTSMVGLTFTATETGVFAADFILYFTGPATQQMLIQGYRHLGTSTRLSRAAATNAMTADTNLQVEAVVGSVADSVTIHSIDVYSGG